MSGKSRIKLDLLALSPVKAALRWRAFPLVLQVVALLGSLLLVANGLGLGLDLDPHQLKTFRKTNLTTLLVWGLWWPGMIALVLGFGRLWCTVCPMELVNRLGDGLARKAGWPRARMGKLLRSGWLIVALYLSLQLLVAGASLHRVPHYTAIMLLGLGALALVTGLVFRLPRSFCRAFCPAGALLSVYGRHTAVQLETRDRATCDDCTTRECVDPSLRHRLDRRSCPSGLRPYDREPADGCVMCLQCAKVCPRQNMGLGLVPREASIRRKTLLRPYEAAFVMVALGFVSHEVIGEIQWLDALFHRAPLALATVLPALPFHWLEAMWFLLLFPLAVWALIAGAGHLAGHRGSLGSLLLAAATGAAPIVAAAHLAKAMAKLSSWGAFLPLSVADPRGVHTFERLAKGTLGRPVSLVGLDVLGWVMLGLVLVLAWRAWRWARQIPASSVQAARAGLVSVALLFGTILTVWAWPHP